MLIEVHHGDACVLLVNGNCRPIHLLNYIRSRCCLSPSIKLDLCLINSGEPFNLSPSDLKLVSSEQRRFPTRAQCVLTRIDEEGTYIPLLNDPTLMTNEFLAKLKRATSTKDSHKIISKSGKQSTTISNEPPKRRRSLKSVAIVATIVNKYNH